MSYLLLLSYFLLQSTDLNAQNSGSEFQIPDFTPVTPSASELAKAITFSTSLNTGLVDIKIPLYELKCVDITLPIYLTYHGSRIKVQSPHSWVGAGWTLVAEPQVSRIIKDLSDDFQKLNLTPPHQLNNLGLHYWITDNVVDKMPDQYFYQLADRKGGFVLHRQQGIPEIQWRIEFT